MREKKFKILLFLCNELWQLVLFTFFALLLPSGTISTGLESTLFCESGVKPMISELSTSVTTDICSVVLLLTFQSSCISSIFLFLNGLLSGTFGASLGMIIVSSPVALFINGLSFSSSKSLLINFLSTEEGVCLSSTADNNKENQLTNKYWIIEQWRQLFMKIITGVMKITFTTFSTFMRGYYTKTAVS